ncbi:hypothetical protein BA6E_124262 [Bacteroidales bacterium 6E]|nr:hypothetical protein BA6E_124262 [Bacteroidales bacterium 6E]
MSLLANRYFPYQAGNRIFRDESDIFEFLDKRVEQ